ncbi:MAG: MFS transporter [Anaerolineae bacterium]|nr:MFS transporter [Thermoflexales bacterium]MDW8406873.1 MFS transporter [Anaerolineae bacterium]
MPDLSLAAPGEARLVRQIRRNERLFILQVLWVMPFVVIQQQYVPVLATRLGASPFLLGMLTSGSALMLTASSVLARWYVQRAPNGMRTLILPVFLSRAALLLIPAALLLPGYQAEALVLTALAINFIIGIVQVTFFAFLPKVTLAERTAVLMSGRWTGLGLAMAVGTPVMALILDHLSMPLNYFVACSAAVAAGVIEIFIFAAVKPLPAPTKPPTRQSALKDMRDILRHAPAARYLGVTLAAQLALNAAAPLIPLKLVRELNASDTAYGWYITIYWLALASAGVFIPRLTRRFGNRRLFALGSAGIGAQMLLLAVAQDLSLSGWAGAIGGLASGLFQVTAFGLVRESAPPGRYESFVSAQLSVSNFAIFAAPLLMSGLLSAGLSVGGGLLICAAGNFLAGTLSAQEQVAH